MLSILELNKTNITDFASERNNLLRDAKCDWVLFLDSDETISTASPVTNFQFPISNKFSNYQFLRKNYFLGQYVGTDKIIRLVKKGTGKFVRAVHEVWQPNKSHSRCGMLNSPVIIHNTANNLKDYLEKINNYSTLHAKANLKEGKKSSLFKITVFPIAKFFVTLIKSKHVVFSIMQSLHSFLSWAKMYFRTEQK